MLKGIDMVVYQALKRILGDASITAVLDDSKYVRSQSNEDYSENIVCVARTARSPILDPIYNWMDKSSPRPEKIRILEGGHRKYMYKRKRVTWLNHPPDSESSKELSVAYRTVSLLRFLATGAYND